MSNFSGSFLFILNVFLFAMPGVVASFFFSSTDIYKNETKNYASGEFKKFEQNIEKETLFKFSDFFHSVFFDDIETNSNLKNKSFIYKRLYINYLPYSVIVRGKILLSDIYSFRNHSIFLELNKINAERLKDIFEKNIGKKTEEYCKISSKTSSKNSSKTRLLLDNTGNSNANNSNNNSANENFIKNTPSILKIDYNSPKKNHEIKVEKRTGINSKKDIVKIKEKITKENAAENFQKSLKKSGIYEKNSKEVKEILLTSNTYKKSMKNLNALQYCNKDKNMLPVENVKNTSFSANDKKHLYPIKRKNTTFYYQENSENSQKRDGFCSPIGSSRITTFFGQRSFHPIKKISCMHHGLDFAAPHGSRIFAAKDGVITSVCRGYCGGYGNSVRIKHSNGYQTFYAHMSKFGNIRPGMNVSRGSVIGFVGMTGIASGPHLHYEVSLNNRRINPMIVQTNSKDRLFGKNTLKFEKYKNNTKKRVDNKKRPTVKWNMRNTMFKRKY